MFERKRRRVLQLEQSLRIRAVAEIVWLAEEDISKHAVEINPVEELP